MLESYSSTPRPLNREEALILALRERTKKPFDSMPIPAEAINPWSKAIETVVHVRNVEETTEIPVHAGQKH